MTAFIVVYLILSVFSFFCKNILLLNPEIIYTDPWFLVLNKPAGLNSEPDAEGNANLLSWVEEYIKKKGPLPANFFPALPHRLDRPTSGLVIVTLRKQALVRIGRQFEERLVQKTYFALVEGNPPESAVLEHWHRKNAEQKRAELRPKAAKGWTEVALTYRTVMRNHRNTLLEIQPKTGKYHQIRAQLSAIGYPILNDQLYGARKIAASAEIALHAGKLKLNHPKSDQIIEVEAPLPISGVWTNL